MRSQIHGKVFEDTIKACELFSSSADRGRSNTASFDIESEFDKKDQLPISIKTTKNKTVGLADARRFFSLDQDFKMIIGCYTQDQNIKSFHSIYEVLIRKNDHKLLTNGVSVSFVKSFHEILSIDSIHDFNKARELSHAIKSVDFGSKVVLNPKIDSKKQRRLQASISLDVLVETCEYRLYQDTFSNIVLPLKIVSPSRA